MSAHALAGLKVIRTSANDCFTRIHETRIEDTIFGRASAAWGLGHLGIKLHCIAWLWEAWRLERSFFSRQDLVASSILAGTYSAYRFIPFGFTSSRLVGLINFLMLIYSYLCL